MKLNRSRLSARAALPWARRGIVVALSAAMVAAPLGLAPAIARADDEASTSSELEAAKERLTELTRQLEMAQATAATTEQELADTQARISELETEVAQTARELAGAQDELAQQVTADYKNGGVSLAQVLLSSASFDELTSRMFYAGKVADAQSARIDGVRELQASLEEQQSELSDREAELTDLLAQQTASAEELASSQSEAESYVNGLSSELQAALEAERAQAAEESRREQEEAQQETPSAPDNGGSQTNPPAGDNTGGGGNTGGGSDTGGGGNTGGGSSTAGNGSLSQAARSTIVSVANSQVGCAYGWGAMNPGVAFDCSGLTTYAYSCAGISLGRTAQAQYNQVVAAGNLKTDPSTFVAGDLVFWGSPGSIYHVAVYIGGGRITHASDYSTGVITTSVTYGGMPCGGGSPV